MNVNVQMFHIDELKHYERNPRKNDKAVKYVAESIKQFGFKVPVIIDCEKTVVCGHTRLKAGRKLGINNIPCIVADDLTPEQIKAFRLADNKVAEFSEWDMDLLHFELDEIVDISMADFGFDLDVEHPEPQKERADLKDEFIVPPFTVFDSRLDYWQQRKRAWKSLGIKSEVGRNDELLGKGYKELSEKHGINLGGTSIFDPVLCEIVYRWFNIEGGSIFDPFAGGSVRGVVAEKLGYNYTGIDLRAEQVEANANNAREIGVSPTWICDDSLNADDHVADDSVDMVFSCPPYADLEVYSNDPRDISNMDYASFLDVYRRIIEIACRKLKNDRFAVFVVGDVRDKGGMYYDFISHTKQAFIDCGVNLYNEIIKLDPFGTAPLRARLSFNNRKLCKVHQNVLVFYKGDPSKIKSNYNSIGKGDIDEWLKKSGNWEEKAN